jgi:hypothetical protein
MNITSALFKMARMAADVSSLSSGDKMVRRGKNKIVGRMLGKVGFWRGLWK